MIARRRVLMAGAGALLAPPPALARAGAATLAFDELYRGMGVEGLKFSERLLSLRGSAVEMTGYMAPPLKAESKFFVLTREPMAICPFCQSDADWPVDIVVIYLRRAKALVSANDRIRVSGKLEVGSWTDPETAFVSQVRIVDAEYRTA